MKKLLLATTAVLALSSPALADTFSYTSESVFMGTAIQITSPNNVGAETGMIQLTGSRNGGPTTVLDAWCVDIFHTLLNSALYNIVPLTDAGSGAPNPTLTDAQINAMGTLMNRGVADTPGDVFGAITSAAFQLAIWNVEYGGTLTDNASTIPGLVALVNQLVTNAEVGGIWYDPNATVDLLDAAPTNQVLAIGLDVSPVPLPATVWLFAGGLGILGVVGRRKRRSTVSSFDAVAA